MWECLIDGGAARTQGFGCTHLAMEPGCGACDHWHSGWDLAAACGRAVYASCPGLVVGIGHDPGYGPHAVFLRRADGWIELYGHLQDHAVEIGDPVTAGQVIGHVGTMGNSTGCHLHYSVRPPYDPMTECGAVDPAPFICSCTAAAAAAAPAQRSRGPNGLTQLLLLGARPGIVTSSPAAPGLGITWEP